MLSALCYTGHCEKDNIVEKSGEPYEKNYGVDRYTKSYPVYFTNYGDGQNALYTYLTALLIRFFGASKSTVRAGIAFSAFLAALAGIVSGISLYTYALIYIVLPVYLFLWLLYGIRLGKIRIRSLAALALPLAVLAAPLIMVQLINTFSWPEMQMGPVMLTRLPTYRSGELGLQNIFSI